MQFPLLRSRRLFHCAAVAFTAVLLPARLHAENPQPQVERLQTSPVLRHLKPNPVSTVPKTGPERTIAQMYLPEGFKAELVVAEPDLQQPVAFAFDERGRIWVAEAYSYPQKRPAGQGLDKIVIFEDRDGDGKFETRKVFAEGLNLVSGFEVGHGGVWVGAAPELLYIPDRNHDDIPDGPPQVLLDGFGYQDTHECLNSFLWGPDGWLYGNQGVFNLAHIGKPGARESERVELRSSVWRYHPVRHEFEVFAEGGSNQWGLDYDEHGQIFMTHCRSYWGRGCTTHVIQGGVFWNQANANYAPYIIAEPPRDFPEFRNFLLASARYDHGAGGAGKPGSDAIYGGHSHVGTMIYLGDNWPDEYRGHLFTLNLHGHQMNQQMNLRLGSGFDTVHAGKDQFFCSDPMFVGVDLQYGPDGAVYVIDWYDQQHCHNPNTEKWDRENGRIYRIEYASTYQPKKVDLGSMDDAALVKLQTHHNDWYARMARRLLQERSLSRSLDGAARTALLDLSKDKDATLRLRGLWALHLTGGWSEALAKKALADADEYVRAWAIQILAEDRKPSSARLKQFVEMAKDDPSALVRLYLASAVQRVPENTAWDLIDALARHAEDAEDRNLPLLLWDGLAQRMPARVDRAFATARRSRLPLLADYVNWYAATFGGGSLNQVIAALDKLSGDTLRRQLAGIRLAVNASGAVPQPAAWKQTAPALYANSDPRIQRDAESLAAVFGDDSRFPQLRETLGNTSADAAARRHAFEVLSRAQDRASLPVFLRLLDDAKFRASVITLLARFDAPEVANSLIAHFDQLSAADKSAALNTLTSRATLALPLLDAVATGKLKRDQLTAYHVRQLTQLKNRDIDNRVTANWGRILQSPADKQAQIAKLGKIYDEAPLWAYDSGAGRQHFQKICAQCHRVGEEGARLGPELTGAGKNGARYFLENIIDPNAVIGADFQLTTVETEGGDVFSGIISAETPTSLTLRTTADPVVIAKGDIKRRETSDKSLMPEGLLDSLNGREQIELLKFLTSN